MIKHNVTINSFEELQKLLSTEGYSKIVFSQNKNKYKVTVLEGTIYYSVMPELNSINAMLNTYSRVNLIPNEIRELFGGMATALGSTNALTVKQWLRVFEAEETYGLNLGIPKKLKNLVKSLSDV